MSGDSFDAVVIGSGLGGLTAAALLAKNPHPSREQIDQAMTGNICRCATYQRIRRAIQRAAQGEA